MLVASMLQSDDNQTSLADVELGKLVDLALSLPEVAGALGASRASELASVSGGPEFLGRLQSFLDAYGWRVDDWTLVHVPTWAEDPTTPLRLIATYVRQPEHAPGKSHKRAAQLRQQAEREVASRLGVAQRPQFDAMLAATSGHVRWAGSCRLPWRSRRPTMPSISASPS